MTADTDALSIEQLTEVRKAAKLVFESGVLDPHVKQHMWETLTKIDRLVMERRQQEPTG